MYRQVKSSSVSPQQIQNQLMSFQSAIAAAQTQIVTFQAAVTAAEAVLSKTLTNKELEALNLQKTELVQIMADYINQRKTRVDTVNRLNVLSTKIA
jgi:hypothetical protein